MKPIKVLALVAATTLPVMANPPEAEKAKPAIADLKGWHETPESRNRACRFCLEHRLTMRGVVDHFGALIRIEIQKDTMIFFYAPSQVLTMTFDGDGRVVRCRSLDGLDLDRKDVLKGKTTREENAEQDGADQPATAPELKPEGKEKPAPESEVRPQ